MQLALWEQGPTEPVHHFMELHYFGGVHRVIDTANPDDDDTIRDMNVYSAGFVSAEEALKIMQHSVTSKETTRANAAREAQRLADFWTKPHDEQMRLSCKYGEPPEPLTDEEKDEMAGCGC